MIHLKAFKTKTVQFSILALITLGAGCVPPGSGSSGPPTNKVALRNKKPENVTPERAQVIAAQAVKVNDGWEGNLEFETPSAKPDGGWMIIVHQLPRGPGKQRTVYINQQGELSGYEGGKSSTPSQSATPEQPKPAK